MRREGLGVFPGKNQSCSPCRETPRTGGNHAESSPIHIYPHPLGEALGRERTSTSARGRVADQCHYASGSARAPTAAASPRRRWTSGLRAAPARTPRRPRPRRSARAAPWSSRRRASAARRHSAMRARPSSSRPAVRRAAGRRSRRLATPRPANDASPSQQASREHDARPFPVVVPSRATPRRSQSMYSRFT